MKAATGELNLTVITIIAIGAIAAFFTLVLWPNIKSSINDGWDNISGQNPDVSYVEQIDFNM